MVVDTIKVVIDGEESELAFHAWDAITYKHASGCLAVTERKWDGPGACQCNALSRASKIYEGRTHDLRKVQVLLPAPTGGWKIDA